MRMYVCMCIYTGAHMRMYVCVRIYTGAHMRMYVCVRICKDAHMRMCMCVRMLTAPAGATLCKPQRVRQALPNPL